MVRKDIGRVLSGVLVALAIILFSAADTGGQFKPTKVVRTISGTMGMGGVLLKGFPGAAVVTDEGGSYTATVDYGWTGTVTPTKAGYTFKPASRVYPKVTENQVNQDYEATIITFVISGSTSLAGVTMRGLPGEPVTDASGAYKAVVDYGWSGTVMPEKEGYRFKPDGQTYTQVMKEQPAQDYTPVRITFVISGTAGVAGATLGGLPENPVTGEGGGYTVAVPYGWKGTVTPVKEGYEFDPATRKYADLAAAQPDQNYIAKVHKFVISGTAGMAGVAIEGAPGNPITDTDGRYTATVDFGWKGTITPAKAGYTFDPPSRPYSRVTAASENHDYSPTLIMLTISGNAGGAGIVMRGLPGDPIADQSGAYSVKVEYGWNGTVTPEKEGYGFNPTGRNYSNVIKDAPAQNFTAARLTFVISGSTEIPGVVLDGLPKNPVSSADGSYSATVEYGWVGTITPKKDGYTFEPASRAYSGLAAPQASQDYFPTLLKCTITGKVDSPRGPVQDVLVLGSPIGTSATTGADGVYTLAVDYGWKGAITPVKEGYTFNPATRKYDAAITKDQPTQGFTAAAIMFTISGKMEVGGTPIEGVTITANNGGGSAVTDAEGKYSVSVPYGWTGEIAPTKEGWEFDPASMPFSNVTSNYKDGEPEIVRPPKKPPEKTPEVQPTGPSVPAPGVTGSEPTVVKPKAPLTEAEKKIADLERQIEEMKNQARGIEPTGKQPAGAGPRGDLETVFPGQQIGQKAPVGYVGVLIDAVFVDRDLREALAEISQRAGERIYVDETVKGTVVTCKIRQLPIELSLREVLKGTQYAMKKIPNSYLVYLPITNVFVDSDIREALLNIARAADIVIVPDESVTGLVTCDLKAVPLDTALEMVLAGTTYVVKKTPYYYWITAGDMKSASFPAISETRSLKLNYVKAARAASLLSSVFRAYTQADPEPNGYNIIVTAPAGLADRIVSDLRAMDRAPRHVMLDARIVTMERGNLLNLGIEWGWPKISAGTFSSDLQNGIEGMSTGGVRPTSWPWGVQIGYTTDRAFTDALELTLNLLRENGEADIVASPQVLAQDGKVAEIRVVTEEYYYMTPATVSTLYSYGELKTIESGTILSITPNIGDNNDITLEMSTEVSNSIPEGQGSDLPVVTRRTTRNAVRIQDGGTVALAGLAESRSRVKTKRVPGLSSLPLIGDLFVNQYSDKSTREVAVFITARLVPEGGQGLNQARNESPAPLRSDFSRNGLAMEPAGEEFEQSLKASLSSRK